MARHNASRLPCLLSSLLLIATVGCAAGSSGTDGGQETPAPGEESGTCLPGDTCNPGLDCIEGICAVAQGGADDEADADGGGAGQDDGAADGGGAGDTDQDGDAGAQPSDGDQQADQDQQDGAGDQDQDQDHDQDGDPGPETTLLIFHNDSGPMCLEALDWLDGVRPDYPALIVEEHLTYEEGEIDLLRDLEAQYRTSQGVSTTFGYLPIIFLQDEAFSGFNDDVADAMEELLRLTYEDPL